MFERFEMRAERGVVKAHPQTSSKGKKYIVRSYTRFVKELSPQHAAEHKKIFSDQWKLFKAGKLRSFVGLNKQGGLKKGPIVTNPRQAYMIAKSMKDRWLRDLAERQGVKINWLASTQELMAKPSFLNLVNEVALGRMTMDHAVNTLVEERVREANV